MQPNLFAPYEPDLPKGVTLLTGMLSDEEQYEILDAIAEVIAKAPLFRPRMPTGPYMINTLTNCGDVGWVSDKRGYRYQETHPETGRRWPPIPRAVIDVAREAALDACDIDFEPDACLVNVYQADGKLSLHRDYDEADFKWPIVSLSFGEAADFALGGLKRGDRTIPICLVSGDVLVIGGESRLRYHGVKKIRPGTSPIAHPVLPERGRVNLTLRRAR
jgi:alkylated DNA repair protein (DNA oxidative demethylase)